MAVMGRLGAGIESRSIGERDSGMRGSDPIVAWAKWIVPTARYSLGIGLILSRPDGDIAKYRTLGGADTRTDLGAYYAPKNDVTGPWIDVDNNPFPGASFTLGNEILSALVGLNSRFGE